MSEHVRFDPTSIISWLMTALVLLSMAYVALYAVTIYFRYRAGKFDGTDAVIRTVADDISGAISRVWSFARPILQLIIILFVIYWFGQSIGLTKETFGTQDIKTTLAFFVVGAFCVAAFLSESPAASLKDFALVVIGFYFGTRAGP